VQQQQQKQQALIFCHQTFIGHLLPGPFTEYYFELSTYIKHEVCSFVALTLCCYCCVGVCAVCILQQGVVAATTPLVFFFRVDIRLFPGSVLVGTHAQLAS